MSDLTPTGSDRSDEDVPPAHPPVIETLPAGYADDDYVRHLAAELDRARAERDAERQRAADVWDRLTEFGKAAVQTETQLNAANARIVELDRRVAASDLARTAIPYVFAVLFMLAVGAALLVQTLGGCA